MVALALAELCHKPHEGAGLNEGALNEQSYDYGFISRGVDTEISMQWKNKGGMLRNEHGKRWARSKNSVALILLIPGWPLVIP